ncbi:MAG: 2-amino-4-hydroxy-6-hydroxymethyldihydropteridine diphosphokinase [Bacteroidales bacterium]|nr:2-amino-4-hydroxy-6-hydroxymethyldihydropteridine diphosphokinase [Bacteroidales bacterium]
MALVNVYFSLGSNLGDREANIFDALRRMDEAFGVHYSALSGLIETEPMGFSGGKFLNAAVLYRIPVRPYEASPVILSEAKDPQILRSLCSLRMTNGAKVRMTNGAKVVLRQVKSIEREMGRTDPPEYDSEGKRVYHSRIIDIDILFYGREIIDIPELTIPHKGIADRPFVMIPLRQIARRSLREAFPEYFKNKR